MFCRSLFLGVIFCLLIPPGIAAAEQATEAAPAAENEAHRSSLSTRELLSTYLQTPLQDPLQRAEQEFLADFPTDEVIVHFDEPEPPPQSEVQDEEYVLFAPMEYVKTVEKKLEPGSLSVAANKALREADVTIKEVLDRAFRVKRMPRRAAEGDTMEIKLGRADEKAHWEVLSVTLNLASEPEPIHMYRMTPGGKYSTGYFDERGYEYADRLLNSPVRYRTISSYLGDGRNHRGIDLRAFVGTPVRTPYRAVVERVNWYMSTHGRCVQVYYVDLGIRALFLHLSRVDPNTKVGRVLEAGDVLGLSGNTGRSTGPHLHYQLEDAYTGKILNPLEIHGFGTPRLDSGERLFLEAKIAAIESEPGLGVAHSIPGAR